MPNGKFSTKNIIKGLTQLSDFDIIYIPKRTTSSERLETRCVVVGDKAHRHWMCDYTKILKLHYFYMTSFIDYSYLKLIL